MNQPNLLCENFPTLLLTCIHPFFKNIHILNFNLPIFSLEASVMSRNDNVPPLNYTYVVFFGLEVANSLEKTMSHINVLLQD